MKQILILSCVLLLVYCNVFSQKADMLKLNIEKGEYWWGGLSAFGNATPYNVDTEISYDLWGNNQKN
ncbi:hypothetical protein [Joostella sp.]|uniref:hypothetical protein n=1 Tax=Joostella sp. TaxID=2231138 RepID=UPI003A9155E8